MTRCVFWNWDCCRPRREANGRSPSPARVLTASSAEFIPTGQNDAGHLSAALKTITRAKRQAEKVRGLLRQLKQNDERLAMTKRYAEVMNAPIDLSDHESHTERRGELMLAVDELMRQLQRDFLK